MKRTRVYVMVIVVLIMVSTTIYWLFLRDRVSAPVEPQQVVDVLSTYTYSNTTDFYTADVILESTGYKQSDQLVRNDITQLVKRFESDYSADSFKNENGEIAFPSSALWTASWKGKITSSAGDFTNYRVDIYEYTGGAHGNPALRTYIFDNNGAEIELEDVFLRGTNYETVLSDLSRDYLLSGRVTEPVLADSIKSDPSILQNDYVYSGTEPGANNFDNFSLEHAGVRISFNAYQVAAYALGQPEIIISWADIKDIVNPSLLGRVHSE
jgi:hypothetical protein